MKQKKVTHFLIFMILCVSLGFTGGYFGGKLALRNINKTPTKPAITTVINTTGANFSEVYKQVADSSVSITSTTIRQQQEVKKGAGSGVIISEDGYIITNNHVIGDGNKFEVTLHNEKTYKAKLIGTDALSDLAILKIDETGLSPAQFGDSDQLEVGSPTIAIGNSLGQLSGTTTTGIISATSREVEISNGYKRNLIQTNAAINRGNSGGGLFDEQGKLIGIVVMKLSGDTIEGIGFAIPSNEVKMVSTQLIQNGYVTTRPFLGINVLDINNPMLAFQYGVNELGLYVVKAIENSPFKSGDRILTIDNNEILSSGNLKTILYKHQVGDEIEVVVMRDNSEQKFTIKLQETPKN